MSDIEVRDLTPFPHPETGVVLETLDDFRKAQDDVTERMTPLFRLRQDLAVAMAERFDTPPLPTRRRRTDKQESVARCPRCGGRL